MANIPHSFELVSNAQSLMSTFIPVPNQRENNQLHKNIGVLSHGTITFSDNRSNRAEFIRVPTKASVSYVNELLSRQWCHGRPSLVISVTGGAKKYDMKPRLLRAFRRGLLKVARTTGAWIITGGMNTGIMKLVGEIVQINPDRSRPIHLIGIATWGCVSGCEQLDVHGSTVHYAQSRTEAKGEAPLEPNHTEFIFVDDETKKKFGGEITFRAGLEQAISSGYFATKTPTNSSNQHTSLHATQSLRQEPSGPVPVVLLVVEGGPNTVTTVHEAVVNNNIPAVFLEGTGRCCDLFAKAQRLYNKLAEKIQMNEDTGIPVDPNVLARRYDELKKQLLEELKEDIRQLRSDTASPDAAKDERKNPEQAGEPKKKRRSDNTDYFEKVFECLHTRMNFLNVISLSSRNPVEPDIDLVILQALLNATSANDSSKTSHQRKHEQLNLALQWNRVDIAKNYIMKDEDDWANVPLDDLFISAVDHNQLAFVKLFLDHDFSLTQLFKGKDILLPLYKDYTDEIDHVKQDSGDSLRIIYEHVIQRLVGDIFDVNAAVPLADNTVKPKLIRQNESGTCLCCGPKRHQRTTVDNDDTISESRVSIDHTGSTMDVDKELFLWSVIAGRKEFALLFWSRGKNKICAALMATLLYRKRARKDNDDSFNQSADVFENLAVHILDKFYSLNPHRCRKAIIRQIPAYGNVTWMELAVTAEARHFISQKAVQDVLNDIWYGHIRQDVHASTIAFTTVMIWYSCFLPYQRELVTLSDETAFDDPSKTARQIRRETSRDMRMMNRLSDGAHMRLMQDQFDTETVPVGFIDVGCWEKTRAKVHKSCSKMMIFMRAPYVKYLYHLYFHLIFLLIFSYVILCDMFPLYEFSTDACAPASEPIQRHKRPASDPVINRTLQEGNGNIFNRSVTYGLQRHALPSILEFVLVGWVFTLLCEEARQLLAIEAQTSRNRLAAYFKSFWNKLDVLAIILFYIGFALRFMPTTECYCAARIVLSVDLTIWFIRSLDIFAAVKRLGPKLVMIGEMAQDLKFFMVMIIVFILAFGVPSYSLIYGVQKFSWHIPREIVNLAYWQIFGELNALETFENHYHANGYAIFILLVAYMAVVSILLVNLLIAMFSNTFNQLQNDTDRIWKFQRYSLVCEYLSRPSLPPPFIVVSHFWRFILYISAKCFQSECIRSRYNQLLQRTKYQILLDEKKVANIEIAEDAIGDEVYYNYLKLNRKLTDEGDLDEERVQTPQDNLLNKMRTLESRIQTINNQQALMFDYVECLMDGLKAMGNEKIRMPERRRYDPDPDDLFEETNNDRNQPKRIIRSGSLVDDIRHRTNSNPEEALPGIINLIPLRRNEPLSSDTPRISIV